MIQSRIKSNLKTHEYPMVIPPPEPRVIWYVDPEMKQAHRDLVKAGMEKARQLGKRIGRPRVTERPDFIQHLTTVLEKLNLGAISRRQAARELGIGYATLKRILDKQGQQSSLDLDQPCLSRVLVNDDRNALVEVLY